MKAKKGLSWTVLIVGGHALLLGGGFLFLKFVVKKEINVENVAGHYKLDYGYGVSELELLADGTYRHRYVGKEGKSKGPPLSFTGKWELKNFDDGRPGLVLLGWQDFTESSIDLDSGGLLTRDEKRLPRIIYARLLGGIEIIYAKSPNGRLLTFKPVDP